MNKKILITGGSGFIGSRLVEELLLDKNYYIVVIDTMWFGCNLPKHKNLKALYIMNENYKIQSYS